MVYVIQVCCVYSEKVMMMDVKYEHRYTAAHPRPVPTLRMNTATQLLTPDQYPR